MGATVESDTDRSFGSGSIHTDEMLYLGLCYRGLVRNQRNYARTRFGGEGFNGARDDTPDVVRFNDGVVTNENGPRGAFYLLT